MAKEWNPHRHLVAAIRKVWRWSPERRDVLKRAKIDKDSWKCEKCNTVFGIADYVTKKGRKRRRMAGAVDHVIPIGKQPTKWSEYPKYLVRTFCALTNLQVLCKACHDFKSKGERQKR